MHEQASPHRLAPQKRSTTHSLRLAFHAARSILPAPSSGGRRIHSHARRSRGLLRRSGEIERDRCNVLIMSSVGVQELAVAAADWLDPDQTQASANALDDREGRVQIGSDIRGRA